MAEVPSSEEALREACAIGDSDRVLHLVQQGAKVNSQHQINGWTGLHWAAKRGHVNIVRQLVAHSADTTLETSKGELSCQLTDSQEIRGILGGDSTLPVSENKLAITPNYLINPVFPHSSESLPNPTIVGRTSTSTISINPQELVLKARLAYMDEKDFIEVELDRRHLTYANLMTLLCSELNVDKLHVAKIRKLPDTILRKDKDVARLRDFQEIEVVLTSKVRSAASRNYVPEPRNEQIFY